MSSPGLRIMRRISPDRDLQAWLEGSQQLHEIEDKQGKPYLYVDDAIPRPAEITDDIVHHATVCFVIFDDDNTAHYVTTSAEKAAKALAQAKPSFTTLVEIDDMPEAEPEDEGPDLPPVEGKR